MPTPKPMIQGTLGSGTSLADVLNVVSASRQWLEVVLDDESRILCKSGQLLDAFAPPDRSGVEAFHSLLHQPGGAYSVYRREPPEDGAEPLGALCKLLAIRPPQVVLEGRFEHFRIRDVLEVLSIGRQTMQLVATRSDGAEVVLVARAGRLLSCEAPDISGVDAFFALLEDPGERFRVTRCEAAPAEPLGRIAELLAGPTRQEEEVPQDVILEGSFADTPIRDLLAVVGLTRQLVELVLRDEGGTRGTVLAKAGRLLDARSVRTDARGREAFLELVRDPGRSFVVRRRGERQVKEPVGTLAELTDEALTAAPVLQGRFQDTSITELLEVVGLSRQLMEIALSTEDGPVGQLLVKAGCVVSAWRGGKHGRDAFRAILKDPGTRFRVTRSEARVSAEPLGTIAEWLRPEPSGLRQLVLEGKFAGVRVSDVLSSVSLSRQHLVVLFRSRGKARGRVALKAGRVLEARLGRIQGWDAVQHLLDDPGESYVVYRMPAGTPLPEPIGTVDRLLVEENGPITEIELPEPERQPREEEPELEHRLHELSLAIGSLEQTLSTQNRAWMGVALLLAVLFLVQTLLGG